MKVEQSKMDQMFERAGISQRALHDSLIKMGTKHLKTKAMKEVWSPDNPTMNYCYVVAEFVYFYIAPVGSIPYSLRVPSYNTLHRFVKWPDGFIVDLTADQFVDFSEVDYSKARRCPFLQTGCRGPSKRARLLASHMGFEENQWFPC